MKALIILTLLSQFGTAFASSDKLREETLLSQQEILSVGECERAETDQMATIKLSTCDMNVRLVYRDQEMIDRKVTFDRGHRVITVPAAQCLSERNKLIDEQVHIVDSLCMME